MSTESKVILMGNGSTFVPLNISNPVINPAIPYVGKIPGGMNQDKAVVFQGTLTEAAKGFIINLVPSDSDDVAFHYNPCLDEHTSMNSCRNSKWELEYKIPSTPFTKGGTFTILIIINYVGYEVMVNGVSHGIFKHRFRLDKVSTVNVTGDVSLHLLGCIDNWSTTSSFKELKTTQSTNQSLKLLPSEISHPVVIPAFPYVFKVPVELHQDLAIFFQGRVLAGTAGFIINFKTGPSDIDDIALHFNNRVGCYTVLNSFRNGNWETEEVASDKPFTKGGAFQMIIVINSGGYEVYVNALKHFVFKHRIPPEKVSTLEIRGDLSQLICGFINSWHTTSCCTEVQNMKIKEIILTHSKSIAFRILHIIYNPAIPYVGPIPGGLRKDMALVLEGSVLKDCEGFSINFKTGSSDGDDITFHYNPHAGNVVVHLNGNREAGEFTSNNPSPKGDFQMIVLITSDCYQVMVNGVLHCTFEHRFPLDKVSTVYINGDVSLNLLGFVDNWNNTSFKELNAAQRIQPLSPWLSILPSEISHRVIIHTLPHAFKIPGGIHQDKAIIFQGRIPADSAGFTINFKTGLFDTDDIALHYNNRIGSYTALNSFRNGNWETEQVVPDKLLTKGGAFQMIVVIDSGGYEFYVNASKHCVFNHRIHPEKVSTLEICGDLSGLICGFINRWRTTSCCEKIHKIRIKEIISTVSRSITYHISRTICNPEIPYVATIPGGIKKDMAFLFEGSVPTDSEGFSINFQTGPANDDDIAFHYNTRIGKVITLNSRKNEKWETEEVIQNNPFTKGEGFQIIVLVTFGGYQVYVNGLNQWTLKHCILFEKVSTILLDGKVNIHFIGFVEKWRATFK